MIFNTTSTTCTLNGTLGSCGYIGYDSVSLSSNFSITQWCNTSVNYCVAGTTLKIVFTNANNPGWITSPDTSSV